MFPTTIAGSLPKPSWLAEPDRLWAPWRLSGDELAAAKLDATLLAIKLQEDAGIDLLDAVVLGLDHAADGDRGGAACEQPDEGHAHRLAEDHLQDLLRACANRDADRDLP